MKYQKFLNNELFILWRLQPSDQLDWYWKNYISKNIHEEKLLNQAIKEFDNIRTHRNESSVQSHSEWKNIEARIKKYKKRRTLRIYSSAIAAVILLFIVSTFTMKMFVTDSNSDTLSTQVIDSNNITFLSGETIVNIDNNSSLDLSENENNVVIKESQSEKKILLKENQLNKLIVPYGRRTSIVLADGSKIDINSGTEIEFPSSFEGNTREISIVGEIFIDVAKNTTKPFIINTPNSKIRVFGTSFNVSAYSDDPLESVVLISGSVEIESDKSKIFLKPNELAEITNGSIYKKEVDVMDYIGWKNGFLQFDKATLSEVHKKIARYYNLQFINVDEIDLMTATCSGKLFLPENVKDVLFAFKEMTSLKYEFDPEIENKILISK